MNKELIIIGFVAFIFSFLFFCKKEQKKDINEPEIYSQIQNEKIIIKIQIPKDHHAYLDSGKDGTLIPVQFDWSDFIQKQILSKEPQLTAKPSGEFEEDVKATVFRGEGIFEFNNSEYLNPDSLDKGILKIKIQMCNDVSGICYRPKIYDVKF